MRKPLTEGQVYLGVGVGVLAVCAWVIALAYGIVYIWAAIQ